MFFCSAFFFIKILSFIYGFLTKLEKKNEFFYKNPIGQLKKQPSK
jgi:hypothetical protein